MALLRTDRSTATMGAGYVSQTANTITCASFTPSANALLCVIFHEFTNDTTPSLVVTDTFTGTGAWSYIDSTANDATNWYVTRFAYAKAGSSPGTGTITCTRRASATPFTMVMVGDFFDITGQDLTTPIRQSNTGTSVGTTLAVSLASACASTSMTFTGVTSDNTASPTVPTSYTQRNSFGIPATAVYGVGAEMTATPTNTISWSALGSYHAAAWAVEIQQATAAAFIARSGLLVRQGVQRASVR